MRVCFRNPNWFHLTLRIFWMAGLLISPNRWRCTISSSTDLRRKVIRRIEEKEKDSCWGVYTILKHTRIYKLHMHTCPYRRALSGGRYDDTTAAWHSEWHSRAAFPQCIWCSGGSCAAVGWSACMCPALVRPAYSVRGDHRRFKAKERRRKCN